MDGSRIELSTLDRSASTRSLTYLNLAEDAKKLIKDGDVLNVSFTSGLTPQSITLTGKLKIQVNISIRREKLSWKSSTEQVGTQMKLIFKVQFF
ncbi:MAG: hypothetical protein CM15mP86_04480 [Gammaproteobacteria bacterium]|nr:MAG: hypothetical protein CM15mP86_04480 [Gammaproteobacteria bacterium]